MQSSARIDQTRSVGQQVVALVVGAIFGSLGWLVVGMYIQRRQFEREAKNAGRAVHFELTGNEVNVAVALGHGVFQPLARSSFDRLLPELATWLPAEAVQTIVDAYASHAGYEQVQRDPDVTDPVRRTLLGRALEVHRAAIAALRHRAFDAGELQRMGLDARPGRPESTAADQTDGPTLLRRYFDAFNTRDQAGLRAVVAADVTEDYPQSGERIHGLDRCLEMLSRYRGVADGAEHIVGDEERWALSPTFSVLRVSGSAGSYTTTTVGHYPDGTDWHIVKLFDVRDGKIRAITSFFAPAFPAPGWRADLVGPIADQPPEP
jgi:ketosteroid isomerase-like protein